MRKPRHGFTLIEVLVVVAIIALLISILLPSLSRARRQARTVQCQAHLHQIGLGLFMYAEQHKGKTLSVWPNRYRGAPYLWDYSYHSMLPRFVGNSKQVYFCPDRPKQSHVTKAGAGYGTVPDIATTYAYNESGWSQSPGFEGYLCDGRPLPSIDRPYDKIWVGDASNIAPERDGWQLGYSIDGFWGPNPPPYQRLTWKNIYNAPGCLFHSLVEPVRHGKGNNCLFYDGRVEVMVETRGRNWRVKF